MNLELSEPERELLLFILRDRLGDLRSEVRHSMVSTATDELKQREKLLIGLIKRLESDAAA